MRRILRRLTLAVLCGLAAPGCASRDAPRAAPVRLTVSAAASLREAMTELADSFHARNPGVEVRLNFGASGALRQQVEQGAGVDLFVAAAARPMDELAARRLVDPSTRGVLAGNELVLVVPVGGGSPVRSLADLASPGVRRVALGAPASVPAGEYALEALRTLGVADAVAGKTVYAQSVRQVLAYVESGNVDAGIVYRTDAGVSRRVRVAAAVPPGSHRPVVYPLAVVSATPHPRESRALAAFLLGPTGAAVLRRRGFTVPPRPGAP